MWISFIFSLVIVGLIILILWMLIKIRDEMNLVEEHVYQPVESVDTPPYEFDTLEIDPIDLLRPAMRGAIRLTVTRGNVDDPELHNIVNEMHDIMQNGIDGDHETTTVENETYEEFVDRNIEHNDDRENVHESQVVRELRSRYQRLIELNGDIFEPPEELAEFVTKEEMKNIIREQTYSQVSKVSIEKIGDDVQDIKVRKTDAVFNKLRNPSPIIALSTDFNDLNPPTDEQLFLHVWHRIHSPDNLEKILELETAIVDQIVDCGKIGTSPNLLANRIRRFAGIPEENEDDVVTTVCPQGRAARLLQTFTFIDADPLLSKPIMDEAEYRNEAFSKSYRILQNELKSYTASTNPINELYESMDDEVSATDIVEIEKFKNHVKEKIRTALEEDYDGLLPEDKINSIVEAAQLGV